MGSGRSQAEEDAWLRGVAFALAEVQGLLINAGKDKGLCRIARDARLTLAEARRIGVSEYDINLLRRAGIN